MLQATTRADEGTSVRIHLPDERLRSFATFYYFVEVRGALEDFLYPEWGNVRFSVSGSWNVEQRGVRGTMPEVGSLFGPTDRAMRVTSRDGVTAGFGLTPLGWQRLIQPPASDLANRIVPFGDRWGQGEGEILAALQRHTTDQERVALFDRMLLDRLEQRPPNTAEAIRVDQVLRTRPQTVAAFADAAELNPRALGRVCKAVYGFGPKRLLRRQRFLDTLGRMRVTDEVRFADLRDPEYFDQSHFNHEFHEFMGLSPKAYLSVPRPLMGQAALVQMQAGIPLSFALPPPPEVEAA